jgi:hypothetical protein
MIVELHNNLQQPLVIPTTRLLLTTDDGTPIAFAVEYAPGHWRVFHAGDKDFVGQLKIHKFDKTVIVDKQNRQPIYTE